MSGVKDRRQALLDQSPASLNGIDYVILAPKHKSRLEVHFLTLAALAGTHTEISITNDATDVSLAVVGHTWSHDSGGRPLLRIDLAVSGDASTYTLHLKNVALDRFFDRAQFSFAAGEASELDCETPAAPGAGPSSNTPPIDYLAKDFLSFRKALSDYSALQYPAWQERSEADFGVMFLEALAALGDDLSYQQDRVAAEAYLATATERISVLRHARLVGYEAAPAQAARTVLQFSVTANTTAMPAGLAVSATGPDGALIDFETGTGLADATLYRTNHAWNEIPPYWWDDSTRVLPPGAKQVWAGMHGLGLVSGDQVLIDTQTGAGLPDRRELVVIAEAEETSDPLYHAPVTRLRLQAPTTLAHDLSVTTLRGNLVPATQGLRHVEAFAISSGIASAPAAIVRTGPGQTPLYLFTLGNAPLTWLSDGAGNKAPEIVLTPLAATPWTWYRSLLDAPAFATGFTIDPTRYAPLPPDLANGLTQYDYDGCAGDTIRFGDGEFGDIPDPGTVFTVTYRAGAGADGNLAADAITGFDLAGPVARLASAVTNPFAAMGGADPESLDSIRKNAPFAFRAQRFNAAIAADYVAAAATLPWVGLAGCQFRHTGSWLTGFTTAAALAGGMPGASQAQGLVALLDRYHLAGFDAAVLAPDYVSLDLVITVTTSPAAFNSDVAAAILLILGTGVLPNGSKGFFVPGQFGFGQPLERSALAAAIQGAQGVAGVTSIKYRRSYSGLAFIEMSNQVAVAMNQIIRVQNDPRAPLAGSIAVRVSGGK
jgi:hypothetical protein